MQVRDLIEQLQKFDPSAEVKVEAVTSDNIGRVIELTLEVERLQMASGRYQVEIIAE